jgi:hypothetical protein
MYLQTWPDGVVPYEIDPQLAARKQLEAGLSAWMSSGVPVRFYERSGGEEDYVVFTDGEVSSSKRGLVGGRQEITLPWDCRYGDVLHECGHAVGLAHEHNRPDRDKFLTVVWENIYVEGLSNFQIRPPSKPEDGNYDFGSIMHYSQMAYSRNRAPTLVPHPGVVGEGIIIGQRRVLSDGDLERLWTLYGNAGA